jgi:hypothetical protein
MIGGTVPIHTSVRYFRSRGTALSLRHWELVLSITLVMVAACNTEQTSHEGSRPGECSDGADNDSNGAFDCDDLSCANAPACLSDLLDAQPPGSDLPDARAIHDDATTQDATMPEAGPEYVNDAAADAARDAGTADSNDAAALAPCGDGQRSESEACDGSDLGGATCAPTMYTGGSPSCRSDCTLDYGTCWRCGDGITTAGETCDDGASNSDDWRIDRHCNATCTAIAPYCGDGATTNSETCDDGPSNSNNWQIARHCNASCTAIAPYCGDAVKASSETCDDGVNNGDAWSVTRHCNSNCTAIAPYCGDGQTHQAESCDDGLANSEAWSRARHCNSVCSGPAPYCGDGVIAPQSESCDDATANSNNWQIARHCNASCTAIAPYCGDGTKDSAETCDDGASNSDAWSAARHCNVTCTNLAPYCGDGTKTGPEVCDDGPATTNNWLPMPHCNGSCSGPGPTCGDGVPDAAEQCGEPGLPSSASAGYQQCYACTLGCSNAFPLTWSGYSGAFPYGDAFVEEQQAFTDDLRIYDASNPDNGIPLLALPQFSDLGKIVGLDYGRAYMLKGQKLSIVDVSDIAHQQLLGTATIDSNLSAGGIRVHDGVLAAVNGSGILYAYDVSNPAAVRLGGTFVYQKLAGPIGLSEVSLVPPLIIAITNDSVVVVDARDLGNMSAVGEVKLTATSARALKTRGPIAYVLGGTNRLMSVDFSVPSAPALVGQADSNLVGLSDFVIAGAFAFVTGRDRNIISGNAARLWRVEIPSPDNLIGREYKTLDDTLSSRMSYSGGFMFANRNSGGFGLQAFNLCCPSYLLPCQ